MADWFARTICALWGHNWVDKRPSTPKRTVVYQLCARCGDGRWQRTQDPLAS